MSILGLGYVGYMPAACSTRQGYTVAGIDVGPAKVDKVNAGWSTILERGIGKLVAEQRVVVIDLVGASGKWTPGRSCQGICW